MSTIENTIRQIEQSGQTAFMPFVTAGDPDLDFTAEVLIRLAGAGCRLVELGFPYSDPVADGPVIQESYTRALAGGVTVDRTFETVRNVTSQTELKIVAMVSYAIIYRIGPESFIRRAVESGMAGAIVPDLPCDESGCFATLCDTAGLSLVQLIAPTTPDDRAVQIAKESRGFVYCISVAGITGERNMIPGELCQRLAWLRAAASVPVCVGFGISQPDHAKVLAPHADGLIVGSAVVSRIARAADPTVRDDVLEKTVAFVREMADAARR